MRVLITRPHEDAAPLAERVAAMGHEPVIEPLLAIRDLPDAPLDLDGVQAVAFTSANGVRALVRRDAGDGRGLPAFAVGAATARAAREAGFVRVEAAEGDVAALARLVARRCDPARGAVLHVAGRRRAGDLAGALRRAGFEVRRAVLYEAALAPGLTPGLRARLAAGEVGAVLIFSPRTARHFVTLLTEAGLAGAARALGLVALSPAVAKAAGALAWRETRIAARPDQDALLACLEAFGETE